MLNFDSITDSFSEPLFVYSGSTFDGCISLEDLHKKPFYISEGDELILFIQKKSKKNSTEKEEQALSFTFTCNDEIAGKYPFKLSPETTASLNGDYDYYVCLKFADGDYYQIVPHTTLRASVPYGVIEYYEEKNHIHAIVPRVMAESGYEPALFETQEFIENTESSDNQSNIRISHIRGADIVMISNNFDPDKTSPTELIAEINNKLEYYGAKNPYITGFFYSSLLPYQSDYKAIVKEAFGQRFIDVEEILKTPVLSEHSELIVSSIAFDLIRQKPTEEDILKIMHKEYPDCIMQDERNFNDKGRYAVAKTIIKEAMNNGI